MRALGPARKPAVPRTRRALLIFAVGLCSLLGNAKEKPLTGVLLYQGPAGPAYVQLSGISLNGKVEASVCTKGTALDSSAYRKLARVSIANALELERDADNELALKTPQGIFCIVPSSLKLEKNTQFTTRDLADKAVLQATIVSKSANGADAIPELKAGFKLYFAPADDTELAEFLRATHWKTLDLLRMYVAQYPNGSHIGEVKQLLATVITTKAEAELDSYQKSLQANAPVLDHLRDAKLQGDDALHVVPGFVRAQKLEIDVRTQVQEIVSQGRGELQGFLAAMGEHTPGYAHLVKAQARVDDARKVDATLESVQKLGAEVSGEQQKLDAAVNNAQAFVARAQYDQAFDAIVRYRYMAGELPKVAAVIDAAFQYRRDRANDFGKQNNWDASVTEYRRALVYKEDATVAAALKNAEEQLQLQKDKATAAAAVETSKDLADKQQIVEAYETLNSLTPAQRQFVGEELEALKKPFVQEGVKRADNLSRLHLPIRGRADEDAVRLGFHYLKEVSALTDDEAIKVKLDVLSDRIGEYYLTQARRMFDKPSGSGVGLGWKYLQQAQRYKPELDAVKDEMTKHASVYEMRSKLSLGIRFRDETSRRDSVGFADQLTDAVAATLESSGLPTLKVVTLRASSGQPSVAAASGLEPNFELECDILQHRVNKKVDTQRVQSHYRAGTREVKNPVWAELRRQLDAAQDNYNRVNAEVLASGKKVKAETANNLQDLESKVEEARKKTDAVPETKLEDIIEPYNYTRRTIEVTGIVEFAFRLDNAQDTARELTTVKLELPKTATVLENVKPEDTDGVQEEGVPIDEMDVLSEAERQVQAALIKKINEKLEGLALRVLDEAHKNIAANDLDAAAERYILYLNCTPEKESAERLEARQFLDREYNLSETSGE